MPELTHDQLIDSGQEFVLQQLEQHAQPEPEPAWTGSLTITPDAVRAILLSNNEE